MFTSKRNLQAFDRTTGASDKSSYAKVPKPTTATLSPPLSAVVTARKPGHLSKQNIFRRYAGSIGTSSQIGNMPDADEKAVIYQVGIRYVKSDDVFKICEDPIYRTQQVISTNAVSKTELLNLNKKFTNFSGHFDYMDLSALGYTLAVALAHYTLTGTITCDKIRDGSPLAIRAVHTRADPVSAASGAVFIPRSAALDSSAGAFAALCAAANAWGSVVFTDVVEVDGNNAPNIIEPTGHDLAIGIVHALRILLSLYNTADAGPVMAFAITVGIHNTLSVVAHTDEGGYVRDVFRSRTFCPPFGGIFVEGVEDYIGLPIPQLESQASYRSLVDSIALATAALVAVAEPTTVVDGRSYPTVFTSRKAETVEAGDHQTAKMMDAVDLANQIGASCGVFCRNYVRALGILFCVEGDGDQATNMLQAMFKTNAAELAKKEIGLRGIVGKTAADVSRHLDAVSIAPWFWVEPTTLIRHGFDDFLAVKAGFAHLADVGALTQYPMFESLGVTEVRGQMMNIAHSWRTARTNALIWHLGGHPQDGLASIIPRQFSPDSVHLPGGADTVRNIRQGGGDIAAYLWGRGQSPLPAPAEFIYLGSLMGSVVKVIDLNETTFECSPVHFPNPDELRNCTVDVIARSPSEISNGALGDHPRSVRDSRTNAATALSNARTLLNRGFYAGGSEYIISDREPSVRDVAPEVVIEIGDYIIKAEPGVNNAVIKKVGSTMPVVMFDQVGRPSQAKVVPKKQAPKRRDEDSALAEIGTILDKADAEMHPARGESVQDNVDSQEGQDGGSGTAPLPPSSQ